jgi:hypothetical protein
MSHVIATISLFALFATISATVHADECFCLSHADGGILRGCEAKGTTFLCTDPETLKKSVQKITSDWKRIEAGTDRCVACRPTPRGAAVEVPRGDDEPKK